MKNIKLLLIVCAPFFCFSTCAKDKEEPCRFRIVNNSTQRIFQVESPDSSETYRRKTCATREALVDKFHSYPEGIAPGDIGCNNSVYSTLNNQYNSYTYIYIYIYDEIKDMSCEEFKQKDPIKKIYALNKAICDSLDWTITYDGK